MCVVALLCSLCLMVVKVMPHKGNTDFNDLHVVAGLDVVRAQIMAALVSNDDSPVPPLVTDLSADTVASNSPVPPNDDGALDFDAVLKRFAWLMPDGKIWDSYERKILKVAAFKPFVTPEIYTKWVGCGSKRRVNMDDIRPLLAAAQAKGDGGLAGALDRYVYLNPSAQAWDRKFRKVVLMSELRYAIADCFDDWVKHSQRKEIPVENLVFDPTQQSGDDCINRFKGLPVTPVRDDDACRNMRAMLYQLCNCQDEAFDWLVKWLAYPLQNVGAKMISAVLMHSDVHGSGKSYFFDAIFREIYGEYSRVFGQAELESQYNDWLSETLFGVFEEVLSRSQKYSHTGTVKQMISGNRVRLNKKYLSGWEESNHMNCVFLSNEVQPLPIEPSDRRFLVVWPRKKLGGELKDGVCAELANGGATALYGWLLSQDLTGFDEHTQPPMTREKQRLIDFGKQAWQVFYDEWEAGDLDIPFCSVLVNDLFKVYSRWCSQSREHAMGRNKFSQLINTRLSRRPDVHYDLSVGAGQKKGVFFIVGKAPEGKTQSEWLGGCVAEVQRILGKYDEAES